MSSPLPLQLILVDFDGVLCRDRFWRSLPPRYHAAVQDFLFSRHLPLVKDWMRGYATSEEINHLLSHFLDIPYTSLWPLFVNDCKTMNVSIAHLRAIERLRMASRVILVTANMDSFDRFTIPSLGLDTFFDDVINSSSFGLLKGDEDGRLLKQLLSRFDAAPSRSLLIDDSLANIQLFRRLGGRGIHINAAADLTAHLQLLERDLFAAYGAIRDEAGHPIFPPFRHPVVGSDVDSNNANTPYSHS